MHSIPLNILSRKLGSSRMFPLDPTVDEFDSIIDEICHFLREMSASQMRLPQLVNALFLSGADVSFIDDLLFQGMYCDYVCTCIHM